MAFIGTEPWTFVTATSVGREVADSCHWRTVPSLLAAASQRPLGLKATE
jgi:hypothetical protein